MRPRSGISASITSSARIRPTGTLSSSTTTTDILLASISRSATSSTCAWIPTVTGSASPTRSASTVSPGLTRS